MKKITQKFFLVLCSIFFFASPIFAMTNPTSSPDERPTARELYEEYGLDPHILAPWMENKNDGAEPSHQGAIPPAPYAVIEDDHTPEISHPHDAEDPHRRVLCAICGEPCISVIGFPFSFKQTTRLFTFHQNCLEKTWKKHPELWRHFIHTHQKVDFIELLRQPISVGKLYQSYGHLPVVDIMQFPNHSIEQWLLQESISDLEDQLIHAKGCKTCGKASSIGCYTVGFLLFIAGIVYMFVDCESCRTDCCREESAWNDATKAKCFFKCTPCLLSMGAIIVGAVIMLSGKLVDRFDGCNGITEHGLREDLARLRSLRLEEA